MNNGLKLLLPPAQLRKLGASVVTVAQEDPAHHVDPPAALEKKVPGHDLAVHEQAMARSGHLVDELVDRRDGQRRAHHDEQLGVAEVGPPHAVEPPREVLVEEDHVRLDVALAVLAQRGLPVLDRAPVEGLLVLALALDATPGGERPVRLDEKILGHPGVQLKVVDVLRVDAGQDGLLLQELEEKVGRGRLVSAGEQVLGERYKWSRVLGEEVEIKDGFGRREVELLQVAVDASTWNKKRATTYLVIA